MHGVMAAAHRMGMGNRGQGKVVGRHGRVGRARMGRASPARPCRRTTARTSAFGAFCIASRCARPCRLRSRTGRSRLHWTTARLRSAHWATARLRSAAWTTARSSALCAFCTELRLQVVRALTNAVVLVHVVCVLLEVVVRASVRYLR